MPYDGLRSCLLDQPVEWLVEQLLTAARSTPMLRAKLAAGADTTPTVDVTGILARLDRAADTGRYVDYREATPFAYHFGNKMDAINDLLAAGFRAAAWPTHRTCTHRPANR